MNKIEMLVDEKFVVWVRDCIYVYHINHFSIFDAVNFFNIQIYATNDNKYPYRFVTEYW